METGNHIFREINMIYRKFDCNLVSRIIFQMMFFSTNMIQYFSSFFSDDSDWNMTVKGSTSTPYIEQLNDNEPALDNLRIEVVQQNNVNNGAFEERLSSSPVKETRR